MSASLPSAVALSPCHLTAWRGLQAPGSCYPGSQAAVQSSLRPAPAPPHMQGQGLRRQCLYGHTEAGTSEPPRLHGWGLNPALVKALIVTYMDPRRVTLQATSTVLPFPASCVSPAPAPFCFGPHSSLRMKAVDASAWGCPCQTLTPPKGSGLLWSEADTDTEESFVSTFLLWHSHEL